MIHGIGIDLVKTDRMKDVVEKWGERFLNRVFTDKEVSYCYGKSNPYLSMAVRFAAKEALIKAVGIPASLRDIEVINLGSGKPTIEVGGALREHFAEKSIRTAHLSLSHEREYGVACVVIEG